MKPRVYHVPDDMLGSIRENVNKIKRYCHPGEAAKALRKVGDLANREAQKQEEINEKIGVPDTYTYAEQRPRGYDVPF